MEWGQPGGIRSSPALAVQLQQRHLHACQKTPESSRGMHPLGHLYSPPLGKPPKRRVPMQQVCSLPTWIGAAPLPGLLAHVGCCRAIAHPISCSGTMAPWWLPPGRGAQPAVHQCVECGWCGFLTHIGARVLRLACWMRHGEPAACWGGGEVGTSGDRGPQGPFSVSLTHHTLCVHLLHHAGASWYMALWCRGAGLRFPSCRLMGRHLPRNTQTTKSRSTRLGSCM